VFAAEDDDWQAIAQTVGGSAQPPPDAYGIDNDHRQVRLEQLLGEHGGRVRLAGAALGQNGEGLRNCFAGQRQIRRERDRVLDGRSPAHDAPT